jgi:hypothetical protein
MSASHVPDEMAAAMARHLGLSETPDGMPVDGLKAAAELVMGQMMRLADAMDAAGFMKVADMLDRAMREMRNTPPFVKTASTYDDFAKELAAVPLGDCRAVQGVYNRFAALLEAEGSFMRARGDCRAKCPSFTTA